MNMLRQYLLGRFTSTTLFTLACLLGLYGFFDAVRELPNIGKGSFDSGTLLIYTLLQAPGHAYELMPLAVLIGAMIAMSQLAATSEYTAIRTAGVSLGQIARIELLVGASRISRENGSRNVAVKANVDGRDQGGFVAEAQRTVAEQVKLPPGYTMTWGGQFENQQRAMARLKVIVPASLIAIFGLLFWMFRSYKIAAIILALAPTTLIGGLFGLAISGLHLSISAAVGFIAVSGIAIQNGVIMVEEIVRLVDNGATLVRAVREGAVLRMRPIIMTALMAGLGLLPAALSSGIGSETQRPFAVVIVGGIISATICTLYLLPVMFSRLVKREKTS